MNPTFRDNWIRWSLWEASAYLKFSSYEFTRKWRDLSENQRYIFYDVHGAVQHLQDSGYAIDDFMLHIFEKNNGHRMHMIQRNKALLWFLIASNQKLVHKDLSLRNQKMVEDNLSKHYPCSKIPVGSSCSMAHLVHGLIEICRWRLPFPWVHTAAIVIVGSDTHGHLQEMVTVHLGILYSETHWALSVHHKDADHMMIYDGNNNEDIAAKALEWPQCRASMMSGVADTDFYWPQIKC